MPFIHTSHVNVYTSTHNHLEKSERNNLANQETNQNEDKDWRHYSGRAGGMQETKHCQNDH